MYSWKSRAGLEQVRGASPLHRVFLAISAPTSSFLPSAERKNGRNADMTSSRQVRRQAMWEPLRGWARASQGPSKRKNGGSRVPGPGPAPSDTASRPARASPDSRCPTCLCSPHPSELGIHWNTSQLHVSAGSEESVPHEVQMRSNQQHRPGSPDRPSSLPCKARGHLQSFLREHRSQSAAGTARQAPGPGTHSLTS